VDATNIVASVSEILVGGVLRKAQRAKPNLSPTTLMVRNQPNPHTAVSNVNTVTTYSSRQQLLKCEVNPAHTLREHP
jgi:hypothetical protein